MKLKFNSSLYRALIPVMLLFSICTVRAQSIISPDTVCIGTTVPFSLSGNTRATTYAWEFGTNSLVPVSGNAIQVPNTGTVGNNAFSVVAQATMVYDTANDVYYAFVTSASSGFTNPSVQRLYFGTNPHGTPVATNLGNPNNAFIVANNANMEAVEIVLDDAGIYHAFFANRGIVHWVFGNGLNSPPTQASRIFDNTAVLGMAMQMSVMRENGQWIIFCGQWSGTGHIVRVDLGANLNAIPAAVPYAVLPAPAGGFGGDPCYFAILKQSGSWYMQLSLLSFNSPLYRYNFGANIQNNTPAITNLSTIGPVALNLNRGMNFIKSCDSFYMLGLNQNGEVLSFNFQNNINAVPTTSSLGQVYGPNVSMQVFKPYWYQDTLWALSGSWNNNSSSTVYRFPLLTIPSGNAVIRYYDATATHTFTTPGVYDVTLYCDQADPRGPQAFCKQIVVVGSMANVLGNDTILCGGTSYNMNAASAGATGYLWSTGQTTPSITVTQSGTYWVQVAGTQCAGGSDTVSVTLATLPVVNITPQDTIICAGSSVDLQASGTGSFQWSPGASLSNVQAANTTATPASTTLYHVTITSPQGCTGKDSILVTVVAAPDVDITTPDPVICDGGSVVLHASGTGTYQWSPVASLSNDQAATTTATPASTTMYYVTVTNPQGCTGTDSILITVSSIPDINITADRTDLSCPEPSTRLHATGGTSYSWQPAGYCDNPLSADPLVTPGKDMVFYVTGKNEFGCAQTDSIRITFDASMVTFIPNAFSPNDDGLNDYFVPRIACDMTLQEFSVYNRFGERVYHTGNTPVKGWDGRHKGLTADAGTYFWILLGVDSKGNKTARKGDVILIF